MRRRLDHVFATPFAPGVSREVGRGDPVAAGEPEEMAIELRLNESAVTERSLLELSRKNPGYRFELSAEGMLIVAPSCFFASGGEAELAYQVMTYAKSTGFGRAFPSIGGFRLPDTSIVAPDTTFVTHERLALLTQEALSHAYIPLVPNVVFELLSPSDSQTEARRKLERYLANGVDVAVLIGPDSVEVWRVETREVSLACDVPIGPEMPGFKLDVESIRRAAMPPTP